MSEKQDKKRRNRPRHPQARKAGSREAKRLVGVILEVWAGTLLPSEAASALGMSTARYYMLESRALAGMLSACEPRPKGHARTPERELEALKKTHTRLQNECARYQALVRAMHRTVGLAVPNKQQSKTGGSGKACGRRKPTVRALKLAEDLKSASPPTS